MHRSIFVPSSDLVPSPNQETSTAEASWVSIMSIETETGLTKDVIRKWEVRYGFPCPERDKNGDRIYPAEQVASLRLIQRLLGVGMRPHQVVGKDIDTLRELSKGAAQGINAELTVFCNDVRDVLVSHDTTRLASVMKGYLLRQGLLQFVTSTLSGVNVFVGEAWLRGELNIFEERLYSEVVQDLLRDSIRTISSIVGVPRVLLTTAPGEQHSIGLLMAEATLCVEGANCTRLGTQTPLLEIVKAAKACSIDVVGLSFSVAHPARDAAAFLKNLREQLDPDIDIWVGGMGATRLRRMAGVRLIHDLEKIGPTIRAWTKTRNKLRDAKTAQCSYMEGTEGPTN